MEEQDASRKGEGDERRASTRSLFSMHIASDIPRSFSAHKSSLTLIFSYLLLISIV